MNEEDRKYIDKALEKIVPPLELCKHILRPVFADSALSWYRDMRYQGSIDLIPTFLGVEKRRIPAPTLEEIMGEMAKNPRYYNNAFFEIDGDGFIVGAFLPNRGNPGSTLVEHRDRNGATAAIKLFLGYGRK